MQRELPRNRKGEKDSPRLPALLIDWLSSAFSCVSSGLIVVCAAIVIVDIVARLMGRPTTWGTDFTIYFMIMFVFLSLPEALKSGAHISADIVVQQMSARMQKLMNAIGLLVTFFSSGIFAYYAALWAVKSIRMGDRSFGFTRLVLWPVKLVAAVSLTALALMALRLLIAEFKKVVRNEESVPFGRGLDNPSLVVPVLIGLVIVSFALLKTRPIVGLILLLLSLLASGTPIAFSILAVALSTFFFTFYGVDGLASTPSIAYEFVNNYTLLAVPMFIFAGNVMAKGGLGKDIFDLAQVYVGHTPGGLGIAVAVACSIFGAISGSSVACAFTIGSIAYPAMVANGYDKGLAAGLIATAGGIGILIPPSNSFLTYGLVTGEPIGRLFIAGVIPGLLMALFLSVTTVILAKKSNAVKMLPRASWKERIRITRKSIWAILMPVVVLGGIYTGFFTVTEAAAVSAVYAVLYSLFSRSLGLKDMARVLSQSTENVAFLLMIMMACIMMSKCVTMLRLPEVLMACLGNTPGWVIVCVMMLFCVFLGCFLEGVAITLLTVPVIRPVLLAYGYDLTWYGVLLTVNLTLAAVTPPVGLNLFVMQRIGDLSVDTVVEGALPFLFATAVLLVLIGLFPELSLWLPSHMG